MSEHISKSELFCNKRYTVKSSTLDPNISIVEMSCENKKICGYEANRCHAYLEKIIYIYILVQIISLFLLIEHGCCSGLCWVHNGRCM